MINEYTAKRYCKDDISKIENYENAVDDVETWDCHHRDEIRILQSGMIVIRSAEDLIENNRYFNCPANELIFIRHNEHTSLHLKYPNCARNVKLQQMRSAKKGKKLTNSTKNKISIGTKLGFANMTAEQKRTMYNNLSNAVRNYSNTAIGKLMRSKATKGTKWFNNGVKNVRAYTCPTNYVPGKLSKK